VRKRYSPVEGVTDSMIGTIETLKHLKKDVTEIRKGMDCGIAFKDFNDVQEGDEIVCFTTFEVAREL
jgi:translation initiation factor IF-2